MSWWRNLLPGKGMRSADPFVYGKALGAGTMSQDTQSAIAELSRVARSHPDAVEIYLALGNLYRSSGEIERAVQIRQNLIVRPGLDPETRAKTWFELGKDFKRGGFIDRAMGAFDEARKIAGDSPAIVEELARLAAAAGDFERAAKFYGKLGQSIPQTHYMVRLAQDYFADGSDTVGFRWLRKAVKVFPGSLEAWLELMHQDLVQRNWTDLGRHMDKALPSVKADQRFVLLEGVLEASRMHGGTDVSTFDTDKPFQYHPAEEVTRALLPVLERQKPDLLIYFYAAWMQCSFDVEASRRWLEKTLVLNPEFWPARLELLSLDKDNQELTSSFSSQLVFFVDRARHLKRFVCRDCGLKREQVFFCCPRCRSWHSIKYRTTINE